MTPEAIVDFDLVRRLDDNITALREQIKYLKLITYVVSFIAVLAIYAGIVATMASNEASAASRSATALTVQREKDLVSDQFSACVQFNVQRAQERAALKFALRALAGDPEALTDREKRITDAYDARVDNQLEFRDCSQAGISAYYKNPPPDPNGAGAITTTTAIHSTTTH